MERGQNVVAILNPRDLAFYDEGEQIVSGVGRALAVGA
jgi:hypothetical protein